MVSIAEDPSTQVKLIALQAGTLGRMLRTLLGRIADLEDQVHVPRGEPLHKRIRRARLHTVDGE